MCNLMHILSNADWFPSVLRSLGGPCEVESCAGAASDLITLRTLVSTAFHFTTISILAIVASCMFEVPS